MNQVVSRAKQIRLSLPAKPSAGKTERSETPTNVRRNDSHASSYDSVSLSRFRHADRNELCQSVRCWRPSGPHSRSCSRRGVSPMTRFLYDWKRARVTSILRFTLRGLPTGPTDFVNWSKSDFTTGVDSFASYLTSWFRVGMNGDPALHSQWSENTIDDDPGSPNQIFPDMSRLQKRAWPNSRSTQFFINYGNNASLDGQRFAPFGKVVAGHGHRSVDRG